MPTLVFDIQLSTTFRLVDDAGNTVSRGAPYTLVLDQLTPLSLLALYEHLHAKRNAARKEAGLAELITSDVGVVLLAALRRLTNDYVEPELERVAEVVCEVVGEIARERGSGPEAPEQVTEEHRYCPRCGTRYSAVIFHRAEDGLLYGHCNSCGRTNPRGDWLAATIKANSTEPAEVT